MSNYDATVTSALLSLVENAQVVSQNTGNIAEDYAATQWLGDGQMPSLAEVEAEIAKIEAGNPTDASGLDRYEYQRLRAPEYPSIGDQLDALYHAGLFPEEMAAKIQAVKEKYPKPE